MSGLHTIISTLSLPLASAPVPGQVNVGGEGGILAPGTGLGHLGLGHRVRPLRVRPLGQKGFHEALGQ